MSRRTSAWAALAAAVLCTLASSLLPPAAASQKPAVECRACIVVDDLGRELFVRRGDMRLPIASTTKMVTALVVLDEARRDDVVTVSQRAAEPSAGLLHLRAGDRYVLEDLLYALLLASSNDAAVALSEHVAGTEEAFVARMNDYAEGLRLRNTRFVTSHGLDRPGHHSTARDLVTIAQELLQRPLLAKIVATRSTTIQGPDGPLSVDNRNELIGAYRGAIGVKTGYTLQAGNVLVAAAERQGRRVISAVLGSEDSFEDARRLLDFAFERLRRDAIVRPGSTVAALLFDDAGAVPVMAGRAVRGMAHPDLVEVGFRPDGPLRLPLAAGQKVGTVTVTDPRGVTRAVPARVTRAVAAPRPSPGAEAIGTLLRFFDGIFRAET